MVGGQIKQSSAYIISFVAINHWRSYMSHFPFLNQKATIKNAKRILRDYYDYHNLERSLKLSIKSPIISDMPKAAPVGNSQEEKLTEKFEVRNYSTFYCKLIRSVVEAMENEDYRTIIHDTYLGDCKTAVSIMMKLNLAPAQFYRMKNDALLVFAQNLPPFKDLDGKWVDPLVYQNR